MKLALQYLTDTAGTPQAVQLSLTDWKKVLSKLQKYEQAFKLKSDIQEALTEVADMSKSKLPKQTLNDFLSEL